MVEAENELQYCLSYLGWSICCLLLFFYLFICAPTTAFTWLSKFFTLNISSTFHLTVQGYIFEGDLQVSKLVKMTIFKGMCTLKCTKNVSSLIPPSICSLNLSPIQNLKEALPMPRRMYSMYSTSFKNYPSFSLQVPSILSILLGVYCRYWTRSHPWNRLLLLTSKYRQKGGVGIKKQPTQKFYCA